MSEVQARAYSPSLPKTLSGDEQSCSSYFWLLFVAVLAALFIPLSDAMSGRQDADGLLTSIISLQKITWYFWGQDRFLNFLPALTSPIHDIEWNLHAQIFLRALLSFLAPLGILYFFCQSPRVLAFSTIVTNLILIIFLDDYGNFNLYVQHNPFGTSLVMLFISLALLRSRTRLGLAFSVTIGFIAYATNLALLTISFPLIVLAYLFKTLPRADMVRFFCVNALCVVISFIHAKLYGRSSTQFGVEFSEAAISSGYSAVLAELHVWMLVFLAVMLVAGIFKDVRGKRVPVILMIVGCSLLIGLLSCSIWVQLNNYNIRYYLTFVMVVVALTVFLVTSSAQVMLQRSSTLLILVVLALALVWQFDFGGLSSNYSKLVSAPWREQSQAVAAEVHATDTQLIIGDFWDVWPAVFNSYALRSPTTNVEQPVYGVAARGYVMRKKIVRMSRKRGGLASLCFLQTADSCLGTVQSQLESPNAYIRPGSTKSITVGAKKMIAMTVIF